MIGDIKYMYIQQYLYMHSNNEKKGTAAAAIGS